MVYVKELDRRGKYAQNVVKCFDPSVPPGNPSGHREINRKHEKAKLNSLRRKQ